MEKALSPVLQALRKSPLPEPAPWFAARTLARLRHEQSQVSWFQRLLDWESGFGLRRLALSGGFLGILALGLIGWHLKVESDNQKVTFAALEMVAQGEESPFLDEESSWPGTAF